MGKREDAILAAEWVADHRPQQNWHRNIAAIHVDLGEGSFRDARILIAGNVDPIFAEHIVELHNTFREKYVE